MRSRTSKSLIRLDLWSELGLLRASAPVGGAESKLTAGGRSLRRVLFREALAPPSGKLAFGGFKLTSMTAESGNIV